MLRLPASSISLEARDILETAERLRLRRAMRVGGFHAKLRQGPQRSRDAAVVNFTGQTQCAPIFASEMIGSDLGSGVSIRGNMLRHRSSGSESCLDDESSSNSDCTQTTVPLDGAFETAEASMYGLEENTNHAFARTSAPGPFPDSTFQSTVLEKDVAPSLAHRVAERLARSHKIQRSSSDTVIVHRSLSVPFLRSVSDERTYANFDGASNPAVESAQVFRTRDCSSAYRSCSASLPDLSEASNGAETVGNQDWSASILETGHSPPVSDAATEAVSDRSSPLEELAQNLISAMQVSWTAELPFRPRHPSPRSNIEASNDTTPTPASSTIQQNSRPTRYRRYRPQARARTPSWSVDDDRGWNSREASRRRRAISSSEQENSDGLEMFEEERRAWHRLIQTPADGMQDATPPRQGRLRRLL